MLNCLLDFIEVKRKKKNFSINSIDLNYEKRKIF